MTLYDGAASDVLRLFSYHPTLLEAQTVLVRGFRVTGRSVPLSRTVANQGTGTILTVEFPRTVKLEPESSVPDGDDTYLVSAELVNAVGRVTFSSTRPDRSDVRRQEAPRPEQLDRILSARDAAAFDDAYRHYWSSFVGRARGPLPPPMHCRLVLLAVEATIRDALAEPSDPRSLWAQDRRDRFLTVLESLRRPLTASAFDVMVSAFERIEESTPLVERLRYFIACFAAALRNDAGRAWTGAEAQP